MRGLRSTLALVLVLVGLGAYIYFVTWKEPAETGSGLEKVFASVASEQIAEIKVKSESGDVTTVKKEGDTWKVVAPLEAAAAQSEASGLASALSQLEVVRAIDENPTNLGEYGLETPRIEVEFKGADQTAGRLYLGAKTPTGSGLYARRNDDKRVFLIGAFQESSLNRSTFDLRDKTLVTIPRATVQGLHIASGAHAIVLAKKDTTWRLTAPIDARAAFSTAEAILGRMESAQVKSFVSEKSAPADLKQYGLDPPETRLTVNLDGATAVLQFGRATESGDIYARDASKPAVVTVDKSVVDELKKGLDDFRQREVFAFRAFNTTRAEISWSGKAIIVERVAAQGDKPEGWKRVAPTAGELDTGKVDGLLNGLSDMRATAFKDSTIGTGVDTPAMTVLVKFDQGKQEDRVTFGKTGDAAYALRTDDPGVAVVDAAELSKAIAALDELLK